jgi:hypothetical protein
MLTDHFTLAIVACRAMTVDVVPVVETRSSIGVAAPADTVTGADVAETILNAAAPEVMAAR